MKIKYKDIDIDCTPKEFKELLDLGAVDHLSAFQKLWDSLDDTPDPEKHPTDPVPIYGVVTAYGVCSDFGKKPPFLINPDPIVKQPGLGLTGYEQPDIRFNPDKGTGNPDKSN